MQVKGQEIIINQLECQRWIKGKLIEESGINR